MLRQKSKKIFLYFFIFLMIGTFNNRNLKENEIFRINRIDLIGLKGDKKIRLVNELNSLGMKNILFLNENKIKKIINTNNEIEQFSIFKKYPSSLDIKIEKAKFLAQIKKDGKNYFLGSNKKLIKSSKLSKDIPFIFGDFKVENFFSLKNALDKTNFDYKLIDKLFFFKSGRWDIKLKNGILIKLPNQNIQDSLNLYLKILKNKNLKKINEIDLRQNKQIIINGR
tara:strand:- start:1986 stop:2660 length:675 start_codon:yes stop_codon:yes gene_type:complete